MPTFTLRDFLRRIVPFLLVLLLWSALLDSESLLRLARFAPVPLVLTLLVVCLFGVLSQTLLPHLSRRGGNPVGSRRMFWILLVLLNVPVLWGAARLFRSVASAGIEGQTDVGIDMNAEQPTMRTVDLYPYTGWHVQPHYHHRGNMEYEDDAFGNNFEVVSGDHGFFVDFSLDSPPPKLEGEVRIILIGGSAAQGWGGTSNDKMLYRALERKLNAKMPPGRHVRVINLAMGASNTYQNFIALNKWAHPLEPDLILSYSGFNDVRLWELNGSDTIYGFRPVQGFILATRFSESPEWIKRLSKVTTLFTNTDIGAIFRLFGLRELSEKANAQYRAAHGYDKIDPIAGAARQYSHAIRSIARDFSGVPVWVAYQPVTARDFKSYDAFRSQATAQLAETEKVKVFDLHGRWMQDGMADRFPKAISGVHLTDQGHDLVADILSRELEPFMKTLRSSRLTRLD